MQHFIKFLQPFLKYFITQTGPINVVIIYIWPVIFFVILSSSNIQAQVNLTNGLICYYPFSGNAVDASGNGNNGIIQNGLQLTTDRFGTENNAYLFDGIDDYIKIPNTSGINSTNALSIALYFNTLETTSVQTLIGKIAYNEGVGTQFQIGIGFDLYPGIFFGVNPPGTGCNSQIALNSAYVNTGGTVTANEWNCLVVTFKSGTEKIYLNGTLIQTKNAEFSTLNQCSNSDIQIGSWWSGDVQRFKGKIDEVRLYKRALTLDEVNALCLTTNQTSETSFTIPDTICVNEPITVTNTSKGVSNYQWNFCITDCNIPNSNLKNPPPVTYNVPGTYNINLTTDQGLPTQSTISKKVVIVPSLEHHHIQNLTFCKGSSLLLTSAYPSGNRWNSGSEANSLYVNSPGLYWVQTTNGACSNIDSFMCKIVEASFKVNLGNDTSICKTDRIILDASNTGSTYLWQNGFTTQKLTVGSPGIYSVSVKQNGCVVNDTIIVGQLASPLITLTKDTTICQSASITLNTTGGNQYEWYPATGLNKLNIPNPVATPLQTTKYFVTVIGNNNCATKDSVQINVKSTASFSVKQISSGICQGSFVQLQANGGDTYLWQPDYSLSNAFIPNPVAKPDTSTIYKVFIKDTFCNSDTTFSIPLQVNAKPQIFLTKDGDFNCNKPTVQLNAAGGNRYSWTPSAGLSNPNISSPVAFVPASTTFHVLVKSAEGCKNEDSIHVEFTRTGDLKAFQLPTAFTPNGDGLNDCFGIQKWGYAEVNRMEIYSRWGAIVFRGKGHGDCWDGTYKGIPQQTGTFPYIIKVRTACGEVERKGVVTLIR